MEIACLIVIGTPLSGDGPAGAPASVSRRAVHLAVSNVRYRRIDVRLNFADPSDLAIDNLERARISGTESACQRRCPEPREIFHRTSRDRRSVSASTAFDSSPRTLQHVAASASPARPKNRPTLPSYSTSAIGASRWTPRFVSEIASSLPETCPRDSRSQRRRHRKRRESWAGASYPCCVRPRVPNILGLVRVR